MIGKGFYLKHAFKNFPELEEEYSPEEEHFGAPWRLCAVKKEGHLDMYLCCGKPKDEKKSWSIDVDFTISIVSGLQNEKPTWTDSHQFHKKHEQGFDPFAAWNDVITKFMTDNTVSIECQVTIKKMVGFSPEKSVDFDESVEHQTNMTLTIGERKFRVSKMILAYHSTGFKDLFFGVFSNSRIKTSELTNVDPDDFQSFLEIIYSYVESAIQAENVEGLLLLGKRCKVKLVLDSCEKFLLKNDKIDEKLKLRLADWYDLKRLKKDIFKSIRDLSDLQYCVPVNPSKLSKEMLGEIVKKCIELAD